tara:strand:+ start:1441 stop:2739 length:1299 start_codon:yes stop_codon:yes gene_type:complete
MSLKSWGNYPIIENKVSLFKNEVELQNILKQKKNYIPYGNGRSYGDSALANNIIHTKNYNFFLNFDEKKGILECTAGILISDIIETFLPRGWFIGVSPGTKFATVGGAIASDVHGKNHHLMGTFSKTILSFKIMLSNGEITECSSIKNQELFAVTCGGMGLTGIIISAKLKLFKISSSRINQTTIRTSCLEETLEVFEAFKDFSYSVAWVDCFANDKEIGRSIFVVGEHAKDGILKLCKRSNLSFLAHDASFLLNKYTMSIFNKLYYRKNFAKVTNQNVDIDSFFYPLDNIRDWNKIYGTNGFIQYQFVLPKSKSMIGLKKILKKISLGRKYSYLAVLKNFGAINDNWLSFPMEGYSLSLDFKVEKGLFSFLDELDKIIIQNGGRIYLTKDSRVSKINFEKGYKKIKDFRVFRRDLGLDSKFNSLQSIRLEL